MPRIVRKKRKYIKVVDLHAKKVVTVVEVLSPSNKRGSDRKIYLEKRSEYLASRHSFVEIDLLRGGRRPPLGSRHPELLDFYVLACRSWEYPKAAFWTFGLREAIPDIAVPVSRNQTDTSLDLKSCVDKAYDGGRYRTSLSYDEPIKPALREEDESWVRRILAKRARIQ